jgi:hypothetical protein
LAKIFFIYTTVRLTYLGIGGRCNCLICKIALDWTGYLPSVGCAVGGCSLATALYGRTDRFVVSLRYAAGISMLQSVSDSAAFDMAQPGYCRDVMDVARFEVGTSDFGDRTRGTIAKIGPQVWTGECRPPLLWGKSYYLQKICPICNPRMCIFLVRIGGCTVVFLLHGKQVSKEKNDLGGWSPPYTPPYAYE